MGVLIRESEPVHTLWAGDNDMYHLFYCLFGSSILTTQWKQPWISFFKESFENDHLSKTWKLQISYPYSHDNFVGEQQKRDLFL